MKTLFVILAALLTLLMGCSHASWIEGGLYYTPNDDGSYSVVKILKVDNNGVHVRIYSNRLKEPPKKIDESTLYMAGMDHKPNESLGMGHAPLSKKTLSNWKPTFFQRSTVKENELDGYRMWLDAGGGYF